MNNASELFGKRIKDLRKSKGLTQEQLAAHIGIDQKHMSRIELGKSYPSLDRLIRIAEVLQVQLPCLFDFMHLDMKVESVEEVLKELGERDQRTIFRMIQALREK